MNNIILKQWSKMCLCLWWTAEHGATSGDDRMSTYFRAVSRSGRRCPRLRCGEHGTSCAAGTSPVFSTDDAGCPICSCRQLTSFLRPRTTCPPLDCSHLVCVGPVRFSSRLVGHCPVCECVAVDDDASAESPDATAMTSSPSSSCPELDCGDRLRCHGGWKRDPETGCETCDCADVDRCDDCEAVCASSEPLASDCAATCRCGDRVAGRPLCRPLPADCEQRVGCVRSTDETGCEVCRCAAVENSSNHQRQQQPSSRSDCPQTTCEPTCAVALDENGCRVCACVGRETRTTTTTATTLTTVEDTSCASAVDCTSRCPAGFTVVKDDNGCDACACTKPETVQDDVTEPPPCACAASNDCSADGGDCISSCNCSASRRLQDDVSDDFTAAKCAEHVTQEDCDVSCVLATDEAGCPVCLCDDRLPVQQPETEVGDDGTSTTVVRMTTVVGDEGTTTNTDRACEREFVCHPICEPISDDRGCVVECRCDDVITGLTDMQQQQRDPAAVVDPEPRLVCPDDDACSCQVDEQERWTVNVDGCLTCVCVTRSTTSTAQPSTAVTGHCELVD